MQGLVRVSMGGKHPVDSDDEDFVTMPFTVRTVAPSDHSHLDLDAFEVLALQISQADSSARDLVSLSATCHAYHCLAQSATRAWDALVRRRFCFYARQKLDVRLGFPFVSPAASAAELSEVEMMQHPCSGVVDAGNARDLCGLSVAWCATQCCDRGRAAYSRPTIGQLAEAPSEDGGFANFVALERASSKLRQRISVMECDIARLPRKVDMLVIPSNEWLRNPGWGVMDAIYNQGGEELTAWVDARTRAHHEAATHGPLLETGCAITSPAYGTVRAKHLCHCCGVSFYDACQFQRVVLSGDDEQAKAASEGLHQAAQAQFGLLRAIFAEAARYGCRSIAIPAVSAGKRQFPALLAAAITMRIAAVEVLASGLDLEVIVVAFGEENWLDCFECAKDHAVRRLVRQHVDVRDVETGVVR